MDIYEKIKFNNNVDFCVGTGRMGLALQKEYIEKEQLLRDRLVAIYMAGNTTYLDVLLSSEDITSLISNYYMVQQLAEADNKLLETIEEQGGDIQNVVLGKILEIKPHIDSDHLVVTNVDVG